MKVRLAKLSDLDAVFAVEKACFKDAYSKELLLALMILHHDSFFVAELDGGVVGYAVGALMRGRGHVISLAVHPSCRRRGLGRALMKALEDALAAKGAAELELEVREDNVEASALYDKLGFKKVGRISRYYSDGSDALLYRKSLDER